MNNLELPLASAPGSRPGASEQNGKSGAKKSSTLFPRNPLKSFDSDERIQGNPRKSNPHSRGFSKPNGHAPRKSKRINRASVVVLCLGQTCSMNAK
jgi:hypothetical protein